MRRAASLLVLPLILVSGSALKAQSPHVGFSLNLVFPTGDFGSTTYPSYFSSSAGRIIPAQKAPSRLPCRGSASMRPSVKNFRASSATPGSRSSKVRSTSERAVSHASGRIICEWQL